MTKGLLLSVLVFFSCLSCLYGQDNFPGVREGDFSEMNLSRADYFDGNGLWGFIDGGADVYLEYGFEKLFVQELTSQSVQLRIEIYRMTDPEAAVGIFSIFRSRQQMDTVTLNFYSVGRYQIQAVVGRYYISIINKEASAPATALAEACCRKIRDRIEQTGVNLPGTISSLLSVLPHSDLKYFRGKLGIQNGYPDWEDLFDGLNQYSAYLLVSSDSLLPVQAAVVRFAGVDLKKEFLQRKGFISEAAGFCGIVKGNFIRLITEEDGSILLLEADPASAKAVSFVQNFTDKK